MVMRESHIDPLDCVNTLGLPELRLTDAGLLPCERGLR